VGYDWHLYDIGILIIWCTILIYECLGIRDSMEVAWVLCETSECGLGVDDRVQALRHRHLHRLVVGVLVWFTVRHILLLCYALIVAQNG
jgi:hypothetical protein